MTNAIVMLDEYQNIASKTAVYPGRETFLGMMYVAGKLNGEAGEVAEVVFKGLRDDDIVNFHRGVNFHTAYISNKFSEERRLKLKKELGDVLWYVSQLAFELGYTLSEVATDNAAKLAIRQTLGMLQGSGSDREEQKGSE